uniref:Uncharacterized protein n=1 Tax=Trypanosoma brucei TaxID=5691 RepID=Q581P6_9TRYP|nr:hypothetical protein, unlikely [Trypanosoma brucei]
MCIAKAFRNDEMELKERCILFIGRCDFILFVSLFGV